MHFRHGNVPRPGPGLRANAGRRRRQPAVRHALAIACVALAVGLAGARAQPVNVRIDGDRFLLDGEAVFPLAIYVANSPQWMLSEPGLMKSIVADLADSPFHILINYAAPGSPPEAQRQYLDALQKHGLYEIYSLKDYYSKGVWGESPFLKGRSEQEALTEDVNSLKDHPAILGWYLSDEETDADAVRRHHEWVRAADPSRFTLTLVNQPHADKIAPFLKSGDVLAIDSYPIGNGGLITEVGAYTDALVAATTAAKPSWCVVQAYGGYMYRSDFRDRPGASVPLDAMRTRGRAPTPREMRAMTFLALTHGATGIVFYYYKDIQMAFDREQRWAAVKGIGEEVQQLSPVLLAEDVDPAHIVSDNERVHWRAKANATGIDLIAVNTEPSTQSVKLGFPVTLEGASLRSGKGFAHTVDNELLLILDGYEAVVVSLETAETFDWSASPRGKSTEAAETQGPTGGGHWRFEEETGLEVRDALGPGHESGVLTGRIALADVVPPARLLPETLTSRRSLEFTGDPESSLIIAAIDELDVGARDFTLEAWLRPRDASTSPVVAGKGISGYFEDRGFELRAVETATEAGPAYYIQFVATSLDRPLRGPALPYGVWQHVAVTRAHRSVRMYVAGRIVDEASLAPPADLSSRQRFAIGCIAHQGPGVPGNQFDGYIDEVRLIIGEALPPSAFLYRSSTAADR